MKFFLLCKRYYTNKDLITDRFGRLFHLPIQLTKNNHTGLVVAADYRNKNQEKYVINGLNFYSIPFSIVWPFSFILKTFEIFKQNQFDVLIASGDSHFGVLGFLLAKMAKIPFVFDVYDNYTSFGTNKVPFMKSFFYLALHKADLVVCASVPLSKMVFKYNQSVIVIENGVDLSLFKPMDKQQARMQLGIDDNKVVVGFFGSIDKNRGIDVLIAACKILRRSYKLKVQLLLAGKRSIPINLDESWIDYRGMVEQNAVVQFINVCDIVIIPYLPDKQVDLSNACKIAEYLACGVPVVTTRVANYADIFRNTPEAVCEPNNAEDMARAIATQLKASNIVKFPKELTWERLGHKLSKALLSIT